MNDRLRRVVAALLSVISLGVAGVGTAAAQTVPPVEIIGTDLSEFPTVRLAVALSGDAVADGIDPDDLRLTENGEAVDAEVTALSEETIDVILAIDVSGSMAGEPLEQAKVAAAQFLDELPDSARAGIISFGDSAELRSSFTTDRAASRSAIDALSDGGETALYDAVALASQQVNASSASRTALVVLSDGADTASGNSIDEAIADLGETDTDFFAVSLQSGDADEAALVRLAEAGEGSVVAATDPDALAGAYVDLGQRITNQFALVFESTTPDPTGTFTVTVGDTGETASVEVALPNRTAGAGSASSETANPNRSIEQLVSTGEAGLLEQGWALWFGAGLIAIALGITAYAVAPSGPRPRRRSLQSDRVVAPDSSAGERIIGSVRDTATRFTTRAVDRTEQGGTIDAALDRAGIIMRAGEFVAALLGVVIVSAFVLYLVMGAVGVALGVFVPILGAPAFLRFLARRRNAKFADQLSDTLMLMAGSLRSGFGLGAAIDSVAQEMEAPMGVEFQRAILETRLGRDVEDALSSVARRVQNEDFEWVIDAMRIHRQVGGDLAQILDQVSETIRARTRLRRQINALTAEGRLSGLVLGMLPIGLGLILYSSNREYLAPLWQRTAGQLMLAFAIVLLVTGALWLKKLVDVEL